MQSDILVAKFIRILNSYSERTSKSEKYGDQVLHSAEMHLVEIIGKNPNIRTTELAEKMGITKGRVSQLTKVLLKKNLIETAPGRDSKKEVLFSLTKTGKKAFLEHEEKDWKLIAPIHEYLNSISEAELTVIEKLLDLTFSQLSLPK